MKIAVDAMGGDHAPMEIVKGAVQAVQSLKVSVLLVGDQSVIAKELAKYPLCNNISVIHASQSVEMGESPVAAVKTKKDSSINVGLRLVKNGQADAFVSAGNTGALMTAAVFALGRIEGIERPAIAVVWPTMDGGRVVLLDVGANADCKPKQMYQFAHLGSIFAERVLKITFPTVGLLSIGHEDEKGNDLVSETLPLLRKSSLNFVGNVESRDIFKGEVNVFVCDGFTGNVVLKFAEGMVTLFYRLIKAEVKKNLLNILGALLLSPALKAIQKRTNYDEYGGALLLGVKGVCVKAHGSSQAKAVANAIREAKEAVEAGMIETFAQIQ